MCARSAAVDGLQSQSDLSPTALYKKVDALRIDACNRDFQAKCTKATQAEEKHKASFQLLDTIRHHFGAPDRFPRKAVLDGLHQLGQSLMQAHRGGGGSQSKAVIFVVDVSNSMDEGTDSGGLSAEEKRLSQQMLERVRTEGGRMGVITVSLAWEVDTDLDLHLTTPKGEHIYYQHKRSADGGELDIDMRGFHNNERGGGYCVENVYWAKEPPEGRYTFWVHNYSGAYAVPFVMTLRTPGVTKVYRSSVATGESDSAKETFEYRRSTVKSKLQTCKTSINSIM